MESDLNQSVQQLEMDQVDPPRGILRIEINPSYIDELAQSISEIGLIQPILCRPSGDRYEVVAGHRRYLACQKLGLGRVHSIVRKMTDEECAILRATENLQRVDLTPIEEAATYRDLIDEYGMAVDQIARKMGISAGTVKRRLDLLRMPPILQKAIHEGKISMTVGEELWPISDPADLEYYLSFAIDGGCTKEVARQWAKEWKDQKRRQGAAGGEGGGVLSPLEPRPHYITCDICDGPASVEDARSIMVCSGCLSIIRKKREEG